MASEIATIALEARNRTGDIPSLNDLANIAATLAIGSARDTQSLSILAEQALQLWEECLHQRKRKIESIFRKANVKTQKLAEESEIPKPEKFPVTFDDFLRLIIGGRYKANRLKIYRDYVKELIRRGHVSALTHPKNHTYKISLEDAEKLVTPASLDEIEFGMNHAKQRIYKASDQQLYQMDARDFIEWWSKQPAERARKAAVRRWNKKKLAP